MKKYIIGGVVLLIGLIGGLYVCKENFFQKGNQDVKLKEKIVDDSFSVISAETLPLDIHRDQIIKVLDSHYAVVARPSLNIFLPNIPIDFKAEYRGVLQWNGETKKWEKFLRVEDTNTKISLSNNPLDMWFEGADDTDRVAHVLVVDVNGAGSGEGLGKILVPEDIGMEKWKVVDCFDYALDLGRGKKRNIESKECQAVKIGLATNLSLVGETKDAAKVLVDFFNFLDKKEYAQALKLFSPVDQSTTDANFAWKQMQVYSPTDQKNSKEKDLEYYCGGTGTCLPVEILAFTEKAQGDYLFRVQFREKNGEIMSYGPFGGMTEQESIPETQFEFEVRKINGVFKVITAPLYRP